jgi:Hypothetical protein (DUF2513)
MKRDWDLIREVLIEVEALSDNARVLFQYGSDANADDAAKLRASHAALLLDAGYLTGKKIQYHERTWPLIAMPNLSWEGHDLLETLRSKPVWEKIKSTATEKGIELTFDAVKALGKVALAAIIGA